MIITIFTSNQPRHLALIERLAGIADTVYAFQGANTLFPGEEPGFFRQSPVMQRYFHRVVAAEAEVFGKPRFLPGNVRQFCMRSGDLNKLDTAVLEGPMAADYLVVFGATYIRSPLVNLLVERKAINLHMGASPWYRGSSCNFWALYDRHPELVGATIHLLSKGLDSGPMLFHALPRPQAVDGFKLGMLAVQAAHDGLIAVIGDGSISKIEPVQQDKRQEIRYTRNDDFTDDVASDYLGSALTDVDIERALSARDARCFLRPYVG